MTSTRINNRLLLDLDGVIADTHRGAVDSGILTSMPREWYWDEVEYGASADDVFCTPGIFRDAPVMKGALEAVFHLNGVFDLWFVASPWLAAPGSWTEKAMWVEHHFGRKFRDRLVLCTDKRLIPAVALVDDCPHQKPGPWTHVMYPRPWNTPSDDDDLALWWPSWSQGLASVLMERFAT